MGLFDKITKNVQNAAGDFMENAGDAIKNFDTDKAAETISKNASSLAKNAKKAADDMAKKMPKSLDEIDLKKTATGAVGRTKDAIDKWQKDTKESNEKVKEAVAEKEDNRFKFNREDAVKILYCIMAVDGTLESSEHEKLLSIGTDMIDDFKDKENDLMHDLEVITPETSGEDYYYDLRDKVNDCIDHSVSSENNDIDGKMLLWNMLAIALSDDSYSEYEKKLIHYTAKKINIADSIVQEMEISADTIEAIERESDWLSKQDEKYSVVASKLEMLEKRKKAVMDGVVALLKD